MIWTNKHNLPLAMVDVLKKDDYKKVGDYSATGLIKSPQELQLCERYDNAIEQDVSDNIWKLLGTSVHHILDKHDTKNALQEERLTMDIDGIKISGQIDLYENGIVNDYKVTSVYSFLLGDKPEWEAQLNIYGLLYSNSGFEVKGLSIRAILRDWMQSKALYDPKYHQCPFLEKKIKMWSNEKTLHYIKKRISLHEQAKNLKDDALPYCTNKEKWTRETKYAVMKKGVKKARRVLNSPIEAIKYKENNNLDDNFLIETRKGEDVKCERKGLCLAKPFCHQYKCEKG